MVYFYRILAFEPDLIADELLEAALRNFRGGAFLALDKGLLPYQLEGLVAGSHLRTLLFSAGFLGLPVPPGEAGLLEKLGEGGAGDMEEIWEAVAGRGHWRGVGRWRRWLVGALGLL